MDTFEFAESKYGRIYKVAGPCKLLVELTSDSGCC